MVPTVSRDLTILGVGLALAVVSQTTVIAIGSIGAIVLLVVRAVGLGQQISTALQALSDRQASLNQISTAIERYRRAAPSTTGRPAPRLEVVRFEDVWFTYPSTSEPTLAGVDLTLRPGSVVGIVAATPPASRRSFTCCSGSPNPLGAGSPSMTSTSATSPSPAGSARFRWCRRIPLCSTGR